MQVRFGVRNAAGEVVDVEVSVPGGTTVGSVAADLHRRGAGFPVPARVGGTTVDGSSVLGLPPLLQGVVVEPAARPGPVPTGVRVRVVAGPDAGRVHHLPPGRHVVGRAVGRATAGPGGPSLALADGRCSRRHAVLEVSAEGAVRVRDEGSLNGTSVLHAGRRVPVGAGSEVPAGGRIRCGGTVVDLRGPDVPPGDLHPDGAGHLLLNRSPRLADGPAPVVRDWPAGVPGAPAPGFPWLAVLVPLAASGVLALLWSPLSLLLGLASPVLVGGQWWSGRRRRTAEDADRRRARDAARERVRAAHAAALAAEHARRERADPGPADLLAHAVARGARLYERRPGDPDHLRLRVGLGTVQAGSSRVRVERGGPHEVRARDDGDVPGATLHDTPVLLDLRAGVAGVAGPRRELLRTARALLGQVVVWHSPAEVELTVLAPDAGPWRWTAWLPHTRGLSLDELGADLAVRRDRSAGSAAGRSGPARVVLVDGSTSLRRDPRLVELLREGPAHDVHVLCLDSDARRLPAECVTVLELDAEVAGAARLRTPAPGGALPGDTPHDPDPDGEVVPDGAPASWALDVARALAPVRDATPSPSAGVPVSCRLLDVRGLGPAGPSPLDAAAVLARWADAPRGLPTVLGTGARGRAVLDLVADGPHTLVAGTTGAGKSVLLSTLVVALALTVPPDALQFVLVDYKGGAAFGGCTDLPHVAGLVTDLDDHLAGRVLRSLRAEVRRREAVLRAAGVADVRDLEPGSVAAARCPRLVVVVDEFRVLAEDLPEFVGGLVRLASVGRSLGVHLVLATQRPAGVVSPEIRANTNARIALRLQARTDSEDVVGVPEAAAISDRLPGRALLRRGTRGVSSFQTAALRGPAGGDGPRVRRWPDGEQDDAPAGPEVDDLPAVRAVVRAAARARGLPAPPPPWLPALPERVGVGDLPAPGGTVLPFGLLDRPDHQDRVVAAWDLAAGGHLLVVGTVRSGRSTVLRTLARAAAGRDAEVVVLDAGGSLADLADAPGVSGVVGREEVWRAGRVLQRVQEEVDRRRALFAQLGVRDLAGQRERPGQRPLPHLLLLVDGWDGWSAALADVDLGAGLDAFGRLLREGSAAGVRVVVTGDRALATSPVAAATAEVLLLRLANRADAALLGVAARDVPRHQPAGRGLLLSGDTSHEVQVATTGTSGVGTSGVGTSDPRLRVRPLPARVAVADLPPSRGSWSPWGLGGDDGGVVGLEVSGPVLVHGPAGSGRTTALRVLADTATGPVVVVGGDARGFGDRAGRVLAQRAADLEAVLRDAPRALVLVDDADRPGDPALEDVLVRFASAGGRLVGAADGAAVGAAFRGLPAVLRSARTVLLLGRGGRVGAEALGRRPVPAPAAGPGAAFLVHDGAPGAAWTALRVAAP